MKTWLILDGNYLCWRAHHSTGQLSYKGSPTGVIYGFLRDIETLQELHNTQRIVFCFDHSRKNLKRREIYQRYKAKRDEVNYSPIEQQLYNEVRSQMQDLRTCILPGLGYNNVFTMKGFEADDPIASVVHSLGKKEEAIIIASDTD